MAEEPKMTAKRFENICCNQGRHLPLDLLVKRVSPLTWLTQTPSGI